MAEGEWTANGTANERLLTRGTVLTRGSEGCSRRKVEGLGEPDGESTVRVPPRP